MSRPPRILMPELAWRHHRVVVTKVPDAIINAIIVLDIQGNFARCLCTEAADL
jgi:hypothetical protein